MKIISFNNVGDVADDINSIKNVAVKIQVLESQL